MDKNEWISPIEKGLAAKIYLLAYKKPKSGWKIAHEIYGHDQHGVRDVINKLSKEGYFKPIPIGEGKHPKWLSDVDPLISKIKHKIKKSEDSKKSLNQFDVFVLRKVLDSRAFRYLIGGRISSDLEDALMFYSATEFILSYLDILIIISKKNEVLKQFCKKIKNENDYETTISNFQEDEEVTRVIQKLVVHLFGKDKKELPLEVIDDLSYLFIIPRKVTTSIKGLSDFGEKYYMMEPVIQEFQHYYF